MWFLTAYLVLLIGLPSRLIFAPLGAPGTPANILGIGAFVWWCCATVGGQNPVKGLTPLRVAVGFLTVSVLASYANGMATGWYAPPGVRQVTDELWTLVPPTVGEVSSAMISAADRGLLGYAGWVGIALMTAEGLRSWKDLELLVRVVVWLGAMTAVIGMVQFWTGFDIAGLFTIPGLSANADFGAVDSRSVLNRVAGTASHPIEFGVVMGALIPLALHCGIYRTRSKVAFLPVVLIGVACSLSVSRSAVLVGGVALLILFAGWPPLWRRRLLLVVPAAVVLLRVAVPGLVGTLLALFTNLFNDDSVSGRTADYGVVLGIDADHPILGRGLFTFVPRYYRILDNQYLMFLLELGVVGLVAALVLYGTGFTSARRAFRTADDEQGRHLGLALSAAIAGLPVSLLTFDSWSYAMATGLTFTLIGMAAAARQLALSTRPAPADRGVLEPA